MVHQPLVFGELVIFHSFHDGLRESGLVDGVPELLDVAGVR